MIKLNKVTFLFYLLTALILPVQAADKPNILLIVADDMGWTDLGSYGSEIHTPSLDAIAKQGVQFTDFHASVSCSPTRSMLLSGTDNHIAGLGNMGEMLQPNQIGKPGYEGYLNNKVVSLPEVLKDNGYHTYMSGKWHLGHSPESYPAQRGFERSFSMLLGGASYWSDMYGLLAEQEEVAEYVLDNKSLKELPKDFYATRSYSDFLIDSIRTNRKDGKPFLAYLAFTAPHDPIHAPEPWLSMYKGDYDAGYEVLKAKRIEKAKQLGLVPKNMKLPTRHEMLKPWNKLTDDERKLGARGMEVYAGMITNMDYHIGRVVNFLKDIEEYDNTIVIFLSDNGPNPWESEDYPGNKGSKWFAQFDNSKDSIGQPMSHYAYGMGWGAASSGPLDLFKMTVGEGGIRTPLIISGPGIKKAQQLNGFAYVWDLMPTILDYANIEHPKTYKRNAVERMRGKTLEPMLSGKVADVYGKNELVGGEMQNGKWMRQGKFKAVSVAKPYGSGKWMLYDLSKDPAETTDLSMKHPAKMKSMIQAWQVYAKDVGVVLTN